MRIWLFVLVFFQVFVGCADVKSPTGAIKFDFNDDGASEMLLNSQGLKIGTSTPSTNLDVSGNAIISGSLSIGGGSAGASNLQLNGTVGFSHLTVSSNSTLKETSMVLVDSSSENIILTLPYAGNVTGRSYTVKKVKIQIPFG